MSELTPLELATGDMPSPVPKPSLRRWWLAALLGLVVVGLGQVYNGRFARGAAAFAAALLCIGLGRCSCRWIFRFGSRCFRSSPPFSSRSWLPAPLR